MRGWPYQWPVPTLHDTSKSTPIPHESSCFHRYHPLLLLAPTPFPTFPCHPVTFEVACNASPTTECPVHPASPPRHPPPTTLPPPLFPPLSANKHQTPCHHHRCYRHHCCHHYDHQLWDQTPNSGDNPRRNQTSQINREYAKNCTFRNPSRQRHCIGCIDCNYYRFVPPVKSFSMPPIEMNHLPYQACRKVCSTCLDHCCGSPCRRREPLACPHRDSMPTSTRPVPFRNTHRYSRNTPRSTPFRRLYARYVHTEAIHHVPTYPKRNFGLPYSILQACYHVVASINIVRTERARSYHPILTLWPNCKWRGS
mmetsp:Transcript_24820/g.44702  ORF Transcript_24820/g.44702 Transcript_24820/m.44702 type:complete len:310 (+) Transcript_24820:94-1023(+)